MKNTKVAASRFIVTVMFLIVTALSGFPFIKVLVDRLWISNIDTLPLHIMSLIPTTESSITATGIISIIIFIISIISMTALNYKLMDIPTMVGVWLLPFLFITVLFYSDSSFVKILSFIVIAVCIFIFIEIIGIMRKNPEAFNIQQNKSPSFTFYIIYAVSTVSAFICFIIQRFHLNDIVQIVAGAILLLSLILLTYSAFWFLIHCGKNFLIRTLIFAQVVLYSAFYGVNWHMIFYNKKIGITTVFIILFVLSGTISIWQYRKSINIKSSSI